MADVYTGKAQDRRYRGTDVTVTYNLKRCIHAKECIHRLSSVFDVQQRPWINPDGAPAAEVVAVVSQCPSGALHTERHDGGSDEAAPSANTITIQHNGPLEVRGDLEIKAGGAAITDEFRVTLCRCGASRNKPFCDNTHQQIDFTAAEIEPITTRIDATSSSGKLTISAAQDSPLELTGDFTIRNASGDILYAGDKTWLCRCGGSARKPFCDGTHKTNGFSSD